MPDQLYFLVAFTISAAIVLLATPIVRAIGIKNGTVDQPGERKVHQCPMVRLGGVSIFAGTFIAIAIVWWLGGFGISTESDLEVWGVILGGFAFFLIGLADDIFSLSPLVRLQMQVIIAGGVWWMGVRIDFLSFPFHGLIGIVGWLSLPITVFWLVGMANAINWIDGLDGLAAGVSGIAAVVLLAVTLFMQQPAAALIAAALAGGVLGFLRYNFNPAQIFMGDGGAYFIGFTLAGVGVLGLVKSTLVTAVLLPYLILAVPIVDMSAVILARLWQGKSPFVADKRHLHHRLLAAGLSQRLAVFFIYSLALWVGSLALAFAGMPSSILYTFGATLLLSYTSWQAWKYSQQSKQELVISH